MRVCKQCGGEVVLGARGYTHRVGFDKHAPIPVRPTVRGPRIPAVIMDEISTGTKRPSGDAAVFTEGDGR